jgi:hypothetical protein
MSETLASGSETDVPTCTLSVRVAVEDLNRLRALVRQQSWLRVDVAVADAIAQMLDRQILSPQASMDQKARVSKVYTVRIAQGVVDALRQWCRARGWSIGRAVDCAIRGWCDAHMTAGNTPIPRDLRRVRRARAPRDWFVILDDEGVELPANA